MTTENLPDTASDTFADLPLQPTGSGVADLEIAYEQMTLAGDAGQENISANASDAGGADGTPLGPDNDVAESEAHPS